MSIKKVSKDQPEKFEFSKNNISVFLDVLYIWTSDPSRSYGLPL